MIQFGPMTEKDIPGALALWQGMPGIGLRSADRPEALARFLARNPGLSFTAKTRGGELVGASLAGHDGRRGFLYHVAVAPDLRRHGIGRSLVQKCLDALKAEGIDKVNFWVKADNADGLKFWTSVGGYLRDDLRTVSILLAPEES